MTGLDDDDLDEFLAHIQGDADRLWLALVIVTLLILVGVALAVMLP